MKTASRLLRENRNILIAFFVPVLVLFLIYLMREIYPFGDQMYLRSDMYHQYAPFMKLFQSALKDGRSLFYSWNIGLGSNFVSTFAYYLASPLNWIVALFPRTAVPELMSAFIFLKSGLMSAAFTWYLERHFRTKRLLCAAFGIFYALSGYLAAYSWNVMWLDCLVLLPFLLLGLERLVNDGRFLLYTISFGLSVLSNYYIAIMLCIFSGLYLIYLLAAETERSGVRDVLRRIGRYLLYTLIGGLLGAVVYVPALLTLLHTASADSAFPETMRAYFNLLELFAHGTMNAKVTMMDGYVPNIYCGIAIFALVPLFWMNRSISIRVRAGKTALMAVMLFSFAFNIPSFIWHGFHFPNSLPARQSFLYIFLVLTMGCEALLRIRENSRKEIALCCGASILAVFALQVLYDDSEAYPLSAAYLSAGFLLIYGILFLVQQRADRKGPDVGDAPMSEEAPRKAGFSGYKKTAARVVAAVLILVTCFAETLVNMDATGYGTTSRTSYTEDNAAIETLLSDIPDTDFYRVEKVRRRTKNDGAWSGYPSASIFSSETSRALSDFYDAFGMQSGTNSFSWYGATPFSSALLSVRYLLAEAEDEEALSNPFLIPESEAEGMRLFRSRYTLPLGFLTDRTLKAEVNLQQEDPFAVQNDFIEAACGKGPIFRTEESLSGEDLTYTASTSGYLYFYIDREVKTLTILKQGLDGEEKSLSFTAPECDMIVFAGKVQAGEELTLSATGEESSEFEATPAYLNEAALEEAMAALSKEPLEVTAYSDTNIEGTVRAERDGLLFTSIPYEQGWQVFVDGVPAATDDFYGAFLTVPLSAGEHSLSFRYRVPGLLPGALISLGALIALILLAFFSRKFSKTPCRSDIGRVE